MPCLSHPVHCSQTTDYKLCSKYAWSSALRQKRPGFTISTCNQSDWRFVNLSIRALLLRGEDAVEVSALMLHVEAAQTQQLRDISWLVGLRVYFNRSILSIYCQLNRNLLPTCVPFPIIHNLLQILKRKCI